MNLDDDALVACADLVRRSGGTEFEIGYLHDDVPIEQAGWYAHAKYRGARLTADNRRSPDEACDALARRILDGGACAHCHETVRLNDREPGCRWRREGREWVRGCQ